jgi:hypothetical protein
LRSRNGGKHSNSVYGQIEAGKAQQEALNAKLKKKKLRLKVES